MASLDEVLYNWGNTFVVLISVGVGGVGVVLYLSGSHIGPQIPSTMQELVRGIISKNGAYLRTFHLQPFCIHQSKNTLLHVKAN